MYERHGEQEDWTIPMLCTFSAFCFRIPPMDTQYRSLGIFGSRWPPGFKTLFLIYPEWPLY